jgi:1,4-alpha-glucan branching enzyme
LPFSHDEVTHGKQSMLYKMPGDEWQRFANLRLLYVYMFTHPGKKLLFMGSEFGQGKEWDSTEVLDWYVRDYPFHQGVEQLVRDLNHLYRSEPALHVLDFDWHGFEWIDCHDAQNSILIYLRRTGEDFVVVGLNFTPVPRENYRIGVPAAGTYREIVNSDASDYSGSGMGNGGRSLVSEEKPWNDRPHSLLINLPPLAGIVLKLKPATAGEDPTDSASGATAGN